MHSTTKITQRIEQSVSVLDICTDVWTSMLEKVLYRKSKFKAIRETSKRFTINKWMQAVQDNRLSEPLGHRNFDCNYDFVLFVLVFRNVA